MNNVPSIHTIDTLILPSVKKYRIKETTDVFSIGGLNQPIVKIETIFQAGEALFDNPLVPSLTAAMLTEGTQNYHSKAFAEAIDFIGAELLTSTFRETASISLACLTKHLPVALNLYNECLTKPRFDRNDFIIVKENARKKLLIDLENVSTLARRAFQKLIYNHHPYGNIIELEHFDKVEHKQLIDFFERLYVAENAVMFISGHVDDEILDKISNQVNLKTDSLKKISMPSIPPNKSEKLFIEKNNAVQSAIRIGKTLVPFSHPDYIPLNITVTVLGGYFGSRLMTVLREEKGYTYGIGAFLLNNKHICSLVISTEVATEYTKDALSCIYNEMERLCQEPISTEELNNVRSYLIGTLLRSFDGPLNTIESFKSVYLNGLDFSYYENYLNWLKNIQPLEIMQIAQRYLNNNFIEVVVGKMN